MKCANMHMPMDSVEWTVTPTLASHHNTVQDSDGGDVMTVSLMPLLHAEARAGPSKLQHVYGILGCALCCSAGPGNRRHLSQCSAAADMAAVYTETDKPHSL
jgi:hypothetical protein